MGMEFIAAWAWIDPTKVTAPTVVNPNLPYVDITADEAAAYVENATGLCDEDAHENITDTKLMLGQTVKILNDPHASVFDLTSPSGDRVIVAGGGSWGDDPSVEFTHLSNLLAVESLAIKAGILMRRPKRKLVWVDTTDGDWGYVDGDNGRLLVFDVESLRDTEDDDEFTFDAALESMDAAEIVAFADRNGWQPQ